MKIDEHEALTFHALEQPKVPAAWEIWNGSHFALLTRSPEEKDRFTERGFTAVPLYR